jgi:hypothetical protein
VRFFFTKTIGNICTNFPVLFDERDREDEGDRQREEERGNRTNGENGFATFGIIPYILKYCEVTNEKFSDVMNESINLVFYIVSYEILRLKEQEKQLKAIRNKNK